MAKYVLCLECGTIYASPRLRKEIRKVLLQKTFSYNNEYYEVSTHKQGKLQEEAYLLQKYINYGKILDIGCGLGKFLNFFASDKWDRYGVEESVSSARFCKENYDFDIFTGNFLMTNYPPKYFDLITMIDVFYYIDDPILLLSEVHRIIKPSGLLAIELPGLKYMCLRGYGIIPLLLDKKWSLFNPYSIYLNWFSRKGIDLLLTSNNFRLMNSIIVDTPERIDILGKVIHNYTMLVKKISNFNTEIKSYSPKLLFIAAPG